MLRVYTDKQCDKFQRISYFSKKLTEKKLAINSPKGFCFWCGKKKAIFPTKKIIEKLNIEPKYPHLCIKCFLSILKKDLETIAQFGSKEMNFNLSSLQKEKNKLKAKKIIMELEKNPLEYAKKHEVFILALLKGRTEFLKFFEDN